MDSARQAGGRRTGFNVAMVVIAGKDKIRGDQDNLVFNRVSNLFVKP
jgi:hypothetical protein